MANRRQRRHFTAEYKREAVALAKSSEKSIAEVAEELDLTETSLRTWMKQADVDAQGLSSGPPTTGERAEVARLRRVTQELDIPEKLEGARDLAPA